MPKMTELILLSPVSGNVIPLTQVNDPVFSQELMGKGFGIEPDNNKIYAPVSGTIAYVADTLHAFGIKTEDGAEVLVHMGINTVELAGKPFTLNIVADQIVTAGEEIGTMDVEQIKASGRPTTVIVAITNTADYLKDIHIQTGQKEAKKTAAIVISNNQKSQTKEKVSYSQIATDIIKNVGGKENINSLIHCITRLRFYLKDESLTNKEELKKIPKVIDVARGGGQYQVVIGQEVTNVYDEIIKQIGSDLANAPVEDKPTKKVPFTQEVKREFSRFLSVLTESIAPLVGILGGAGMFKGVLAILVQFDLLNKTGGTYMMLNSIPKGVFYFLPVLLGYTSAKRLHSNPVILAVVGAILVYFSTVARYLPFPTILTNYVSSIFPIIFAAWFAKHLERLLKKIIPKMLQTTFLPIIEIIILLLVIVTITGPLILIASYQLSDGVNSLYNLNPGIVGLVVDGSYQFLITLGLHWIIIPIVVNDLATNGHSYLNALLSITMVAQGGAVLALAVRTHDKKARNKTFKAAASAFCGITESAMYEFILKYQRVFILSNIGSGIGGLICGTLRVNNYALTGSLVGILSFVDPKAGINSNFLNAIIAHLTTLLITFILVYFWGVKKNTNDQR
ncbi:glucose PTS transporter subunit IIA [Companilactobacillus keshanensis]|uniref:Glucose PTS transporter subunit IIA n=1 Tax=Companilactobacillus keshanensis TaxID=2486003 RepID=A0ABW4BU24_9LACO|nr:PTS glucose transporter subunit IIABC [Companilactobacillus keshanensis]